LTLGVVDRGFYDESAVALHFGRQDADHRRLARSVGAISPDITEMSGEGSGRSQRRAF
jgi:hypothetical protein